MYIHVQYWSWAAKVILSNYNCTDKLESQTTERLGWESLKGCGTKISYACYYCDVWTDMHHKRWNYNHQKIQVKLDHHKCIEISISYARTDVYYKYSLFPFTYWYGTIHLRSSKTYNHLILLGLLFNCLYNYTY